MKYEKNQYTDGFSICGLIIGGAFLAWGINSLISGGWFSWIGFIFLCIGAAIIFGQFRALTNRSKLRNIVKSEYEAQPDASIEEMAEKTGITKKDVQAIVLDLKARGEFKGGFSSKTGKHEYSPAEERDGSLEVKARYCPNCGTPIKSDEAQFCQFCGGKL